MSLTKNQIEELGERTFNPSVHTKEGVFKGLFLEPIVVSPYKHQVGGGHYQKTIQPLEFINANKFGFNKGNVIKYITRHEEKNGIEDLKKVIHYTLFEAFHSYPEQYENFLKDVHKMLGDE